MSYRYLAAIGLLMTPCTLVYSQATAGVESKSATAQACSEAVARSDHGVPRVQLNSVRRIFVESFGEDLISKEMQSMVVSSLFNSKRFTVTEDRSRADAVLKGVALERTSQEVHAYGEGTAVGSAAGGHQGNLSGSVVNGNGSVSGSSSGGFVAHTLGINDSALHTETIDNARIAVRLVNLEGDVIWTTTQESNGAKYKGASADVADMCIRQLLRDVVKIDGNGAPSASGAIVEASDEKSSAKR